jgi:hypothetical protein
MDMDSLLLTLMPLPFQFSVTESPMLDVKK